MDHSHHLEHHEHHQTPKPTAHAHHKKADHHAGHHTADYIKRFWICIILTIPVLVLSHMIQD